MASSKELKTIQQAKKEFEIAQKNKDEKGMAAARLKADKARGYQTETKIDSQGRYYQAIKSAEPPAVKKLDPVPAKTLSPQALTSTKARTGVIERKPSDLLNQAFDQNQNYVDKFKQGNISGGIANFVGTGLTGAQSLYLNAANTVDSLAQGKGLPDFKSQMSFSDYDKAVAERRNTTPTIQKVSNVNPLLGAAYQFAGEVGTDPLELTPLGFANDIKLAKGAAQGSAAYSDALKNGKMVDNAVKTVSQNAGVPEATVKDALKANDANVKREVLKEMAPEAKNVPVQPRNAKSGTVAPKEQMFVQNGDLPKTKPEPLKDLGADANKFDAGQKVSRVRSNTFQNSDVFTSAEKELLNDERYTYDVVSEKQSLAEAKQRIQADFEGEVNDLPNKARFDGVDTDTAMGILEQYKLEARQTGDYSKVYQWSKLIQERGTESGQMIQAFNKYTRTPEGAVVKAQQTINNVENDIKKTNPNLINKVEKETRQVTNAIKKAQDETVESLGGVVEKAVKAKAAKKSSTKLPMVGNSIRSVEEAVANLTDKNLGELIGEYTEASAKKLANQSDVLKKKTPKQVAPLQQAFDDLTKELYRIAQETLPKAKTTKQEVKATDILRSAIENKQNYQNVWLNAKYLLQRKYANNPEAMELLSNFFDKDVIPNFSKESLDKAIKQTAKDFSADLNKIFKASQKDKTKLAKDIQDYILYKVGVTGDDARALSDEILNQYNAILKSKTESALKQMFPEAYGKTIRRAGQKSDFEKVMELINMGAYDNEAIKNVIKSKNKIPVLENSDIKAILDNMELSLKQTDPYMKNMYASRAEQIIANKMPREFRQKFRALQRIQMILNPKTLITRNPLGNVVLGATENLKDIPGAAIDKLVSLKTGERTTAFAPGQKLAAQAKGFKQGVQEWRKDIKYNVDTSPSRGQMELPQGKVFNDGKVGDVLNAIDKVERYALQIGDRPFYEAAKASRLKELELLGKTGDEAQMDARLYALDRVFQNDSELAKRAMAVRKNLGIAGDLIMPFVQTPANIMDKLLDYSPVGIAKAVSQLGDVGKGTFNQKLFVDRLARTFTGAGIAMFAFTMAKNGILTGEMPQSNDLRQAQYQSGKQGYSVKIGNAYYSYDWMQPIGGILAAVTDAYNAGAEKNDILEAIGTGTGALVDSVFSLSFLSGLLDAFSGYSPAAGIGSALLGSTSQLTSSAGANLAKTIDPYIRETYDPNRFKQQANKLIARTPGASMLLPQKIDITGQPMKQSQGRDVFSRAIENFIAPYRKSEIKPDAVNDELLRLYDSTGETGQLLNTAEKDFQLNGEKYVLPQKDFVQYQKTAGQYAYNKMNSLINSPNYNSMSDAEKAKALKSINEDARDLARMEYLQNNGKSPTLVMSDGQQEKYNKYGKSLGLSETKFVTVISEANKIEGDKLKNSDKTITNSASRKKKAYIDSQFPLATKQQLAFLYEMAGVSKTIGHYRPQFD